MRIAVVAQQASPGGGMRFLRPLIRSLVERYPDVQVTLLINEYAASNLGAAMGLDHPQIAIVGIDPILSAIPTLPPEINSLGDKVRALVARVRGTDHAGQVRRASAELARRTAESDVTYLTWPFFLEPFDTGAPTVGTFHDFNYRHDFKTLGPEYITQLEREVPFWIGASDVVVNSAACIGDEMNEYYGELVKEHRIVRLSTFQTSEPTSEAVETARTANGIPVDYVICPSNTSRHKNLAALLRAYSEVRRLGGPPLVLIGSGTDILNGETRSGYPLTEAPELYEALQDSGLVLGEDLFALGYVTDSEADSLIAGAKLLVAPSKYEAGSGPGMDAWALGTAVAMSSIPPFEEHLSFLGVRAELFDPTRPDDMARAISVVLADDAKRQAMVQESRSAMDRYTWSDVAEGYREAFEAAIEARGRR